MFESVFAALTSWLELPAGNETLAAAG